MIELQMCGKPSLEVLINEDSILTNLSISHFAVSACQISIADLRCSDLISNFEACYFTADLSDFSNDFVSCNARIELIA